MRAKLTGVWAGAQDPCQFCTHARHLGLAFGQGPQGLQALDRVPTEPLTPYPPPEF
eukprot:NODE_12794_length_375_cov_4.365031_g11642_i0.p3 GENE.NODE_12794_length_375_cov_4.365031_g11642_i0~~NODE_12794_length_375_cov_4.365031_g11642_i0.p3  ORF type:complete len:56 (+),score=2.34 NODE_12794_length_375_cov_4.365031_g11642_i0:177-344(+)